MAKRKARVAEAEPVGDTMHDLAARLAQHGEAFMQMFDEPDQPAARAPKRAKTEKPVLINSPERPDVAEATEVQDSRDAPHDAFADIWSDSKGNSKASSQRSPAQQRPMQPSPNSAAATKSERRRFMSGNIANVHRALSPQQQQQQQAQLATEQLGMSDPSRKDFQNMQREVQLFGAEALDKKHRKEFDAWQLQNMKAAPQKPGRMSAAIGKGMAKKKAEREHRAKQEAIASGMLKLKGSGKQRRQASDIDRGLVEDGGLFKAGMLRVKGAFANKASKKGPKSQRRAFSSSKIGNLDGNSQKPWNVARAPQKSKKKGSGQKSRS